MHSLFPVIVLAVAAPIAYGQTLFSNPPKLLDHPHFLDPLPPGKHAVKVDVNLVLLTVSVVDRSGQTVSRLTVSDFEILEDGTPMTITHFGAEDTPCSIGLLFDVSGSMEKTLPARIPGMRIDSREVQMSRACGAIGRTKRIGLGWIASSAGWPRRFVLILLAAVGISQAPAQFRYEVKRDKFWGDEPGVLTVDQDGIKYRSENGNTALDFAFEDIRKADVSDPRRIRLYTYDRSKKRLTRASEFEFSLRDGTTDSTLVQFLAERLERPVVGAYPIAEVGLEVPAYHRHGLGGCHGVLRFGSAAIAFASKVPAHSRTWTYGEIQTIGTMNAFHFRLTSYAETFNFDLKRRLSAEDYRGVWRHVYARDLNTSEVP